MSSVFTRSLRRALAATLAALPLLAHALSYQVSIDASSLAGLDGYIAIDLLKGSAGSSNQVQVSGFASTATLVAPTRSGDVIGTLPAPLTLTSSVFFNEYLQGLTFAPGVITFNLGITTNYVDGDLPDTFALYLLDKDLAPYPTEDPTGADALLLVDLVTLPLLQVFASPATGVTALVPEPAAATMALAGLALLALRLRRRA